MIKIKFIVYLFCILLISSVSALKISPTQEEIKMNQYETKCVEIWVLPHEDFLISTKWTKEGPGEIANYVLTPEEIGVSIDYLYKSDGKYEFCFTPNKGEDLHGIIYFYSEKSITEVGSWIDLKVNEINPAIRLSMITGNTIKEIRENNYDLLFMIISLMLVLTFLVYSIFKRT